MREAEFLHQQGEEAKAAMRATLQSMGHEAFEIVDPRRLTREHPWRLVAAAAAAGFIASKLVKPEPEPPIESGQTREPLKTPPPKKFFKLTKILGIAREMMTVARPILETIWAAAFSSAHGQTNGEHLSQTPTNDPPPPPFQS